MILALSTTVWWVIGYAIGGAVVLVAASLLLAIIALGRRIVRQAEDVVAALDGARENTTALFEVKRTNHALDRITRSLASVRAELGER